VSPARYCPADTLEVAWHAGEPWGCGEGESQCQTVTVEETAGAFPTQTSPSREGRFTVSANQSSYEFLFSVEHTVHPSLYVWEPQRRRAVEEPGAANEVLFAAQCVGRAYSDSQFAGGFLMPGDYSPCVRVTTFCNLHPESAVTVSAPGLPATSVAPGGCLSDLGLPLDTQFQVVLENPPMSLDLVRCGGGIDPLVLPPTIPMELRYGCDASAPGCG
jgi:hypothetical protein